MAVNTQSSGISTLLLQLSAATNERSRLPLLQSLSERLIDSDPVRAFDYAEQALELARELKRHSEIPYCLKQVGLCHGALNNQFQALVFLRKALTQFKERSSHEERAEVYLEMARVEVERGRFQEAVDDYHEALTISRELDDAPGKVVALKGLGDLFCTLHDHQKGLDHYLQALRVAEEMKGVEMTGMLLADIAVVYGELREYERALDCFGRSLEAFKSSGLKHLEVRVLANLANVHADRGEPEEALEWGLRAMTIYEALNDRQGLATTLVNLSGIYKALKQLETAIECSRKAYDLFESLDDRRGRCAALLHTGLLYQSIEQHHNATYVLEQALRIADEIDNTELRYQCHDRLSHSLDRIGDTSRALRHLRVYVELRDALAQEEQYRAIGELQARFDLERTEKEKEIYRLRSEQLEMENKHKTAELTSLSMQLVEKNRFLNDVKLSIEKIEGETGDDTKSLVNDVLRDIRQNASFQEDWQTFQRQFEKVHDDFIHRLSQSYPGLTSTELKICALIRTGLSSGEIASLLHVTRRNVETHRYRLRKKLDIESDVDLGTFLTGL